MPIKGWTDGVRLPRLGTIALGQKDERGVPHSVDYFVVPPEVQEVYGPKPNELDIIIPNEDMEIVFPAYLKRYGDQFGLICRGDGENASLAVNYAGREEYGIKKTKEGFIATSTGEKLTVEEAKGKKWIKLSCPYKNCPFYRAKKCREVAILSVVLPRVRGVLGVYSIDTGSYNSYQNIANGLNMLRDLVGRISLIPLKLGVKMEEKHPEVIMNGKIMQIKRSVPVMYINMGDLNLLDVLQLIKERKLLMATRAPDVPQLAIEPPDEDSKPDLLFGPFDDEQPAPVEVSQKKAVILPEDEGEAQDTGSQAPLDEESAPLSESGDPQVLSEAAPPPGDDSWWEDNPFEDNSQSNKEIPWWDDPGEEQPGNVSGDAAGESVTEPAPELPTQQEEKQKASQQGEWKVRLIEKPPVKPVKVEKTLSWVLAVERNTRQGLIKGTLIVPSDLVNEEFIKSLKPKTVLAVAGSIVTGEDGFVITAQSVRVEKTAA